MEGVPVLAAKADSSSSELVRKATSSSVSLVEIPTTLLEDTLALPLDFLCVTIALLAFDSVELNSHYLSSRSRARDKAFLLFVVGISIDHLRFPFRDGNHSGGTDRSSLPN